MVGDLPGDASEAHGAFVARADGSWLVDGSAAMEEVATHFGIDDLPEGEAGAYHTIGGFVMARLGRVPKTADTFEWGGMRFEVVDMDGRRIDKVLVTRKPPPDSAGPLLLQSAAPLLTLAPMQEVTDGAFWTLVHKYGGAEFYGTENFPSHATPLPKKPTIKPTTPKTRGVPSSQKIGGNDLP